MLIWQSRQPFTAGRSKTWPRLAAEAVWALAFLYAVLMVGKFAVLLSKWWRFEPPLSLRPDCGGA